MDSKNTILVGKEHHRGNMAQLDIFNQSKIMKFTIQQRELLNSLTICSKAIRNSVLPILESFRLQITEDGCLCTASNMEVFITKEIELIDRDCEIDICISSELLLPFLKITPDQPIEFEVEELDNAYLIKIKTLSGVSKLPGEHGKDYPALPVIDSHEIEIDSTAFNVGINKTIFACSTDESMVFASTLIDFGNGITLAATNQKTLAVNKVFENIINLKQCLVRPYILQVVSSLNLEGKLNVSYSDRYLRLNYGKVNVFGSLSEGKFPDYMMLVKMVEENKLKLNVNVAELTLAIKRVLIFGNKITNHIVLTLNESGISIKSYDSTLNQESVEKVACDYSGKELVIGMIGNQILDILSKLSYQNTEVSFNTPSTAFVFKSEEDENSLFINLPSSLN